MKTVWGEKLQADCVLQEYPRPQMRRESYVNLNGLWDYAITEQEEEPLQWQGKILVPFSPECELSGVGRILRPEQTLWYRRSFPAVQAQRVLLHFGAVDQMAEVFINGTLAGSHTGGYTAFTLDITHLLQEENTLLVKVRDLSDSGDCAWGKQRRKRGGIWYTPQSGIWQTVWLEPVPKVYIKNILAVPSYDTEEICITVFSDEDVPCRIKLDGICCEGMTNSVICAALPCFRPWSPEEPFLYTFTAELAEDRVESYFALRKVEVLEDEHGIPRIFLNNRPYFMNGLLDQGYWSDGMYTAPSDEALIFDIQTMKDMGFNLLRKHIKIEPMRWYYHCDRLGMLVWQDMPNGGGPYRFMTISAPLVTKRHRKDDDYKSFARESLWGREQYGKELEEMILQLRNVPSVVLWCPFNEGWGQFDAKRVVEKIRKLDDTRLIDHASGWHDQGIGCLQSLHVYFTKYRFKRDKKGRAVVLSEYGGYNYMEPGHSFGKNFGYRKLKDKDALLKRFESLMLEQILPARQQGLAAAVYTQLSDVEDEVNGLVSYDRKVVKLPVAAVRDINWRLR